MNTNNCEKKYAPMINGQVFKWVLGDSAYCTGLFDIYT
jgi:hypothetical protein